MKLSPLFLLISAVFTTCLIVSNIIVVKTVMMAGVTLTAAMFIFPLSYLFGDVLTEVYGYSAARIVIWIGFLCNILAVLAFTMAGALPGAPTWQHQEAYMTIFGTTPLVLLASFVAYLCGEFMNSFVLARLKIATKGRHLWLRTIGSTLIGEGIDTTIFILIALNSVVPPALLPSLILTQWLLKVLYEIVATPFTYLIVNFLKAREQSDVYDYQTDFNPLHFLSVFKKVETSSELSVPSADSLS